MIEGFDAKNLAKFLNSEMDETEKEEEKLLHAIIDGGVEIPAVKQLLSFL